MSPTGGSAAEAPALTAVDAGTQSVLVQLGLLSGLGLVSAVLHTFLKLRLGIPGHAAVLWLTPILVGRCLTRLRAGGTVASTSAALGIFALRGLSARWPPMLAVATYWAVGPALDFYVLLVARLVTGERRLSGAVGLAVAAVGGVVANYAHLASKVGLAVIRPHAPRLGLAPGLYELVTYLVFGLLAGLLAYSLSLPARRRKPDDAARAAP